MPTTPEERLQRSSLKKLPLKKNSSLIQNDLVTDPSDSATYCVVCAKCWYDSWFPTSLPLRIVTLPSIGFYHQFVVSFFVFITTLVISATRVLICDTVSTPSYYEHCVDAGEKIHNVTLVLSLFSVVLGYVKFLLKRTSILRAKAIFADPHLVRPTHECCEAERHLSRNGGRA